MKRTQLLRVLFLMATIALTASYVEAQPGGCMTVCDGSLQAQTGGKDTLTIGPAFAKHNAQFRMGGAYPLSQEHFTVFFTDLTPFEHVIHIGVKPLFDARFQ